MPVTGKAVFNQDERASWFSHKAETATPYYYKVYLADHDVVTEIAPTESGCFSFHFPENDHSYVVVDAFDKGSFVKVILRRTRLSVIPLKTAVVFLPTLKTTLYWYSTNRLLIRLP